MYVTAVPVAMPRMVGVAVSPAEGLSRGQTGEYGRLAAAFSTYAAEVTPRVGAAGFCVAAVTIDRTAAQVVNTSAGRVPKLSTLDRLRIFRSTIGKQATVNFVQYAVTREVKFAADALQPSPALSTMIACGLTGVPFSSLQYNWAIQDTYKFYAKGDPSLQLPPRPAPGLAGHFRAKVAPGIFWSFTRAGLATGGGLYYGAGLAKVVDAGLRARGVEAPVVVSKVLGGLTTGAGFALLTQWTHNVALVAGRMAALGATKQAPHYTGVALRIAWRELGVSMVYVNFPSRMVIQAVATCMLTVCDIFYRPEVGGRTGRS